MNGQINENQPIRPDQSGNPSPASGPAPLNVGGGFNNQPVASGWSPSGVPAPGPINANAPSPMTPPPQAMRRATPSPTIPRENMDKPASVPPPPPTAQYEVRTLASDSETLKASGGIETAPKTFIPAPLGREKVYNPAAAPVVSAKKKGSSKLILIVGIIVIVAGLGALGFMFLKPLLIAPQNEIPEIVPPEELPEEPTPPEEPEAPTEEIPVHASFFVTPADSLGQISMPDVSLTTLKAAIFAPEGGTEKPGLADNAIKEIVVSVADKLLAFPQFISMVLPEMNAEAITPVFEDDFTLFIHKDGTNELLGFIAKVKADADPETLAAISTAFEASPNLHNFYAVAPGTLSAFKDGSVNGDPVRYAPFSTAGYAFNYGWFKDSSGSDYFVAASSYKGITAATVRAGF